MAIAYHTVHDSPKQVSTFPDHDNVDLLRRYCPGLAVHTHVEVAAYIFPDVNGCWPWPGKPTPDGYRYVWLEPTPYGYSTTCRVHRYMFDTLVGPIPEDHHMHHRCENKPCWHPMHVEAVTPKEHCARHRDIKRKETPINSQPRLAIQLSLF